MAGDNDVAGKWKVAMGQGDNFILTPSHEIPDANRGGILWSRHLPKESQSAPQMEEDFVMEHPENFKILLCRSGTWQRNIKNAICCSSKGKTCGFWRLLLCPWRIEQISLVWKWQNLTFWTVSLCRWLTGRIKAQSAALGKEQFLQHDHSVSSTPLALSQSMFWWW